MSTLIWKELRENLKWAILAMLVLGGAKLYALHHTRYGQLDTQFYNGMTLAKDSFLTVTTFGCAIIGFLLGLIQIVPELPRDRWAALLHRPMPRSRILGGKILAGLLLYMIAVVPPFLFCVWQAATPGHFPSPFVPALALPGIADLCAGLVYYNLPDCWLPSSRAAPLPCAPSRFLRQSISLTSSSAPTHSATQYGPSSSWLRRWRWLHGAPSIIWIRSRPAHGLERRRC